MRIRDGAMNQESLRQDAVVPDGPAAAARLMEPLLAKAAGAGAEPVSITFDYGPAGAAGQRVSVEALVERATRTLVFAVGRVLAADGTVLATGSAVFRKSSMAEAAA
jgi:acyl-coenzyme A thioesterase PaaI-like protein